MYHSTSARLPFLSACQDSMRRALGLIIADEVHSIYKYMHTHLVVTVYGMHIYIVGHYCSRRPQRIYAYICYCDCAYIYMLLWQRIYTCLHMLLWQRIYIHTYVIVTAYIFILWSQPIYCILQRFLYIFCFYGGWCYVVVELAIILFIFSWFIYVIFFFFFFFFYLFIFSFFLFYLFIYLFIFF